MAPITADGSSSRGQDAPSTSGTKKGCLSFTTSMLEYIRYIRAFFVGQAKKMTARSEEEAAEADLHASKMEVEAADAAEHIKKKF
ncbi:unnamed protein product [Cuscuta europaea]|uniref:Uncharacterized protein n=1 Tax=Cuscuta europaea TaxID=41803 RepID=A0A9P0YGJ3_CUSEU|nr:unnamed protein product [Cuscuta europaea]